MYDILKMQKEILLIQRQNLNRKGLDPMQSESQNFGESYKLN